jgi:hypothetical protein
MHGINKKCRQNLIRKPEGKRSPGRLGWKDNIKMGLKEVGCEVVEWIHLAQDKEGSVVSICEH